MNAFLYRCSTQSSFTWWLHTQNAVEPNRKKTKIICLAYDIFNCVESHQQNKIKKSWILKTCLQNQEIFHAFISCIFSAKTCWSLFCCWRINSIFGTQYAQKKHSFLLLRNSIVVSLHKAFHLPLIFFSYNDAVLMFLSLKS